MCQISDDVLHKNQRLESDQYNSVGCCPANYLWVWQDPHPGSHLPGSFKIAPKAKRSRFGLSGVVEGQLGQCGERQAGHLDGLLCCPLNPTLPPQPTKLKLEKKKFKTTVIHINPVYHWRETFTFYYWINFVKKTLKRIKFVNCGEDKLRFQILRAAVNVSSRGKHDWCKFRRGLNDASFYFAPRDLSRSVIIVKTSFEARPTDETCFPPVERLRDFFSQHNTIVKQKIEKWETLKPLYEMLTWKYKEV